MAKLPFYTNGKIVYVKWCQRPIKNMYLRVSNKKIVCHTPPDVPEEKVKSFVIKHVDKLVKVLNQTRENRLLNLKTNGVLYKGVEHKICRLGGFKNRSVEVFNKVLYTRTLKTSDAVVQQAIKTFLKEQLTKVLLEKIPFWEKTMKLPQHNFSVVSRKSWWGQNNRMSNSLYFSDRLAHFNDSVLDYLVVHELTHSVVPGHSADFNKLVSKYLPNWKTLKAQLSDFTTAGRK